MLSKETIEEILIEAPHKDTEGNYTGLPLVGRWFLLGLKRNWLTATLPEGQFPMVSSGPKKLPDGTEGYSIRKEIVFKGKVV